MTVFSIQNIFEEKMHKSENRTSFSGNFVLLLLCMIMRRDAAANENVI
jgi:hypothetical protein